MSLASILGTGKALAAPPAPHADVQEIMMKELANFPGKEGLDLFDQKIGRRIELLPGFIGFKGLTERVAPIVQV